MGPTILQQPIIEKWRQILKKRMGFCVKNNLKMD
jgi:hypothetical protein